MLAFVSVMIVIWPDSSIAATSIFVGELERILTQMNGVSVVYAISFIECANFIFEQSHKAKVPFS